MTDPFSSRLLIDGMLGRLAKWLRILGYDTAYESQLDDNELVRRARAEGRWLLTRDHELAGRPGVHSLLIESEQLATQMAQVRSQLGPAEGGAFSRCPVCNASLVATSTQEVRDRVPPYVLRSHSRFRRCPSCDRIYWPGSHWRRMREQLARFEEINGDVQPSPSSMTDAGG
jgi:uncharacterized protein with PIN domain